MGLIEDLLGMPLVNIERSYWAVKLNNDVWLSEARMRYDQGVFRHFDWSNDLVATGDVLKIQELWLLCPPNRFSPVGNTARLVIEEPGTAFQFKVAHADSNIATTWRTLQAHIIGKVTDKITGACECFIWDPIQGGMITPTTQMFDATGSLISAGKTSVYDFHSWRPGSIAPLGALHLPTLGVQL